jgi:ankyrin repeat protein
LNNHFEKHKIREYTLAANLFYIFADKGYPNLIRTSLREDSQIHIRGERYHYPLFAALASGNKETITALLNSASSIMNDIDITEGLKNRKDLKGYKNRTPLSWAAQEGRLDITRYLLEIGLSINELDSGGRRGLSRASENGHEAVTTLLIEKGADINISDQSGLTALHYASKMGHEAVAKLLIEEGADINISDQSGLTALHYASKMGHEAVARLLIEKGANINISDQYGFTPLHYASERGYG